MKYLLPFIILFLLDSCQSNERQTDRPSDILSPEEMEKVMFDLLLAKEIWVQKQNVVDSLKVNPSKSVLEKYETDSLTFYNSLKFYMDRPEMMLEILNNMQQKAKRKKDSLQALTKVKKTQKKPGKNTIDSIKNFPFGKLTR